MATRNSGKKVAAGVTTAVTLGSFAFAGIAALGLGVGTSGQALTSTSSYGDNSDKSDDGGASLGQVPIRGDDRGYGGSSSGGSSVQSGNGGSISGKSAGS